MTPQYAGVGWLPVTRSAVMIVEHGRVALIHRERPGRVPHHLFPGRKVEEGESPEQAAVREAREELRVRVALDGLLAVDV